MVNCPNWGKNPQVATIEENKSGQFYALAILWVLFRHPLENMESCFDDDKEPPLIPAVNSAAAKLCC